MTFVFSVILVMFTTKYMFIKKDRKINLMNNRIFHSLIWTLLLCLYQGTCLLGLLCLKVLETV